MPTETPVIPNTDVGILEKSPLHSLMKNLRSLLAFVTATSLLCATSNSAKASTEFPMTLSAAEGTFTMSVPDRDTTKSAYGGRLRVYDVHIAKMFEVTHHMCEMGRISPGTTWTYLAGGGSINMGNFQISCDLASDVATAYGIGKLENTTIYFSGEESQGSTRTGGIPILNITGGKIDRWMSFTRNFKPMR